MESPLRITCLLILDSDGERVCVLYPPQPAALGPPRGPRSFDAQRKLELNLHHALARIRNRAEPEAIQADGEIAVGLNMGDVSFFAASPESSANELLLLQVAEAFKTVLATICGGSVSRHALMENLSLAMLALDETADQGLLLETNPSVILSRINLSHAQPSGEAASFNQAITQAKDSLIKSLLSGAS